MNAPQPTWSDQALKQGFQLDELRIDPAAGEVAGPGGREKLDPKVMGVLVLMAQYAGQVVSHEELLARLWPDAVVTDNALTRCFYELRRQLSQAGGSERYKAMFETLPKRGYRLNGEIRLPEPLAGPAPRPQRRRLVIGIATVAALALMIAVGLRLSGRFGAPSPALAPRSVTIAVLPFADLSPGKDQQYLSDGIAEEILSRLARSRDLRVISRSSSFSFRNRPVEIPEIAAKLAVTHVLEGSVRQSGNRVRITAQLAEVASNSQVWSETYDRELGDLFAIQDEIASAVASALRVTLKSFASQGTAPRSHEAYDLFLRGKFVYDRHAPGDTELAARNFEDALSLEPDYAPAWAALAGTYSLMAYEGGIPRDAGLKKQGEAALRAVALDPELAVAQARLAQYYFDIGDRKLSYSVFDRAVALDPDDPIVLAFASGIAVRSGDIDGAIQRYRRIIERDPLSAGHRANLGVYLLAGGRLDEARVQLVRALELNPNFGWGVDLQIARILVLQRHFDEAAKFIGRLPEGEARDHGLALLAHAQGRKAEADAALERLAARSAGSPDIRLAEVYAFRGMGDAAFAALHGILDAIARNEPSAASQLWSWQVELRVSPFLKPLHADPRWQALLVEPTTTR